MNIDTYIYVKEYRLIASASDDLKMFAMCLSNKHEIIKVWEQISENILPEFVETLESLMVQSLMKLWRMPKGYYEHLIMWYLIGCTIDYILGTSYVYSLRHFWEGNPP